MPPRPMRGPRSGADAAFRRALHLAEARGAALTLLHVHRGDGPLSGGSDPLALDRLAHEAGRRGIPVDLRVVGASGDWRGELDSLEWDRWEVALKVAEPESLFDRLLGSSLDQRLARAPRIPVWFVPASLGAEIRVVMAAVEAACPECGELDAAVADAATGLARAEGGALRSRGHAAQIQTCFGLPSSPCRYREGAD